MFVITFAQRWLGIMVRYNINMRTQQLLRSDGNLVLDKKEEHGGSLPAPFLLKYHCDRLKKPHRNNEYFKQRSDNNVRVWI